jgi:hypothetical protein
LSSVNLVAFKVIDTGSNEYVELPGLEDPSGFDVPGVL